MTYSRIGTANDLPPAGPLNNRSREKSDLDFKTFVEQAKSWENAKDVAAFANALGGVLLIGADDSTGLLDPNQAILQQSFGHAFAHVSTGNCRAHLPIG
jgi:predicted HTH transcriptional regulator